MLRRIRKIISILLCITAVLLLILPANSSYAATDVGDFTFDGSTLVKYNGHDANVSLPNTVEIIGKDAFSDNKDIVKVTIPDSVKQIDFAAFENCTNLKQVVIPESVKSIGSSAFSGCSELSKVNIPRKCIDIGSAAFAACDKLNNISVDSKNKNFVCYDGVLYTKDGSKVLQYLAGRTKSGYSMPKSVSEIEEYCFYGANKLSDVSLSSKLEEIPEYAFANCISLRNVIVPYDVESLLAYSFSDCYNLESVSIPDSVGYVDEHAFDLTYDLSVNYYDADAVREKASLASSDESFEDYISSDTDSFSDGSAYNINVKGSQNDNKYYSEAPYTSFDTNDYSDNNTGEIASGKIVNGQSFIFLNPAVEVKGFDFNNAEAEDSIAYFNAIPSDDEFEIIGSTLARHSNSSSNQVGIPNGISSIGNRSFYKQNISDVILNNGLESIGDFAFARTKLKNINIPNGTKTIGYAAFYGDNELENVVIPQSVSRIELGAFDGTKWISNFEASDDGNDFLIVGDGILLDYKGNAANVSIPAGIKSIAAGCFKGNNSIQSIDIPEGVEMIGEDAFNGCSYLTNVALPESLNYIEDRAFKNTSIEEIIIPKNVKEIGMGAFDLSGNMNKALNAVVFLGLNLPKTSYNETATRLSGKELRRLPFAGVKNAVIGNNCDLSEDSILSEKEYGFRGSIYKITSNANDGVGELQLIKSTAVPDINGQISIDPHVTLKNKNYIMTGVSDDAFDIYKGSYLPEFNGVKSIQITGNTSPALEKLLNSSVFSKSQAEAATDESNAENQNNALSYIGVDFDADISVDKSSAMAFLPDNTDELLLEVSRASSETNLCISSLQNKFGTIDTITYVPLDFELRDKKTGVPITKLSGKQMEVLIPIPNEVITCKDINVAALDDNGLMTEIPSEIVNNEGNDKLKFLASHFSIYIIYSNSVTEDIIYSETPRNLSGYTNNIVVQTLNKKFLFDIESKWYIIFALFLAAIIIFPYKRSKHS